MKARTSGNTLITNVVILAAFGAIAWFGVLVVPFYMDYFKVAEIFDTLEEESGIGQMDKRKIRSIIKKRMDFNGIYDLFEDDAIYIENNPKERNRTIGVKYHVRAPMFDAVYVAADFDKSITVER